MSIAAEVYATVAHSVLKEGASRFMSLLSEHEIETAAKQTAKEHDDVTASMLTETLLGEDIGPISEGISVDVLSERLVATAKARENVQSLKASDEIIEEFLQNVEYEVSKENEQVHRALQAKFRKTQRGTMTDVLNQLEDLIEIFETGESGQDCQTRSPKIRFKKATKVDREAYHTVSFMLQDVMGERQDHERVPVTQAVTVENVGNEVVEDCRIWLDYIQFTANRELYAKVVEADLDYPHVPGAHAELFHLQTQLPWNHRTDDEAITLGAHKSVEVELLGETRGAHSFIFPSNEGFPDAAYAHLYAGRNPDAAYPTDWWWLAEQESEPVFNQPASDEESVCFLRVTGSNIAPRYATIEFEWEEWRKQSDACLPVTIRETPTVDDDLSIPLDTRALRDTYNGIPRAIAQPTDLPTPSISPIEVIGNPDESLPPEVSFSATVPDIDTAATASLALRDFDEYAFNYYEYVLAVTAHRIANPEGREYCTVPEAARKISEDTGMLSSALQRSRMPSIEEIEAMVEHKPRIRISDAAITDLKACSPPVRGRHIERIAHFGEIEDISKESFQQLAVTSLDRPLYEFADEGIVLWIAPARATPAIPESINTITIETAVSARKW